MKVEPETRSQHSYTSLNQVDSDDDPEWTQAKLTATPQSPPYTFRIGNVEKNFPAFENVQSLRLKEVFNLSYEPKEIVNSRGGRLFAVNSGTAFVFVANYLEPGQVYNIESFSLNGQEKRIEVALLLCDAAYKEDPVGYLGQSTIKTRHSLGDICVANKGGDTDPKYLVAFSDDNLSPKTKEVFIAVCGTATNYEITRSLKLLPTAAGIERGAHSGLLETAQKIPMELLTDLIDYHQPQRITICGHSAGGAIAHLYLIQYLATRGIDVLPANIDIVSIAFGSPFCVDLATWRWLSSTTNYQERFWSFSHDQDVVPRAFNIISNIYAAGSEIPRVFAKAKRAANSLKNAFPKSNFVGAELQTAQDSLKKLLEDLWVEEKLQKIYVPFGWWIVCKRSQDGHYQAQYELDNMSISERLDVSELTKEAFQGHGLEEYSASLRSALGFIRIPAIERILLSPISSDEMEIKEVDVRRCTLYDLKLETPKAHYVEKERRGINFRKFWKSDDENQFEFTVEVSGSNLEFLASSTRFCSSIQVERFYLDGGALNLTVCYTAGQKFGKASILLVAKGTVDHLRHGGLSKSILSIKTHFGVTRVPIRKAELKDGVNSPFVGQYANEAVYQLLHKAVRRCYIGRRKKNSESLVLLDALDNLERNVLESNKSYIREAIEHCCLENDSKQMDIEDGLPYLDNHTLLWCWRILIKISSDLSIEKENEVTFYLVAAAVTVAGFAVGGGTMVAARLVLHGAPLIGAGVGAAVAALSTVGINWAVSKKMLLEKEHAYRLVLERLLQELKPNRTLASIETLSSDTQPQELEPDITTQTATHPLYAPYLSEKALTSQWNSLGYFNPKLDIDAIAEDKPFRAEECHPYHKATSKSIKKAIRRIQSIILLHEIRLIVLSSCFVTAIGPQNAGKTTALTRIFPGVWDLPNNDTITIGIGKHTRNVTTYEFENLTIVDFPGFNTINQTDTSGPDKSISKKIRTAMGLSCALASVILCVFPFTGSATTSLNDLLGTVKEYIGEVPILICMNKASKTMDDEDGLISANAVREWRARLMSQLGIEDNVQEDIRLEFTDFKEHNEEMEQFGILSATMVREIIVDAIKEQMMVVDSSKVEKMLKSATTRGGG